MSDARSSAASSSPLPEPAPGPLFLVLLGLLAVSAAAAALGGLFTASSASTWYPTLVKPSWTPPAAVFGPVWTLLYAVIAVAAWMVWRRGGFVHNAGAFAAYGAQLVLNCAWSWIFFVQRSPGWASVEICVLWLVILLTVVLFFRRSKLAGWLLIPYLVWVSYAAALNLVIQSLN
jgi:tryptophan-rich sensory protein